MVNEKEGSTAGRWYTGIHDIVIERVGDESRVLYSRRRRAGLIVDNGGLIRGLERPGVRIKKDFNVWGRKGEGEVQLAICWCPRRGGPIKCGRSWQELCEGRR